MGRIQTAEITVNGRRKIVNADDPRVKKAEPVAKAHASQKTRRPSKKAE